MRKASFLVPALLLAPLSVLRPQSRQINPPVPLTISQAVAEALKNYPAVRVSQDQMNAASAAIRLARTAFLPRVDVLAQANRATRNNIFGMLLPQADIPSISGPVLGTNNFGTAWGSALGVLVSWEPFDFGLRRAGVQASEAARSHSDAILKRTRFEVAAASADAFLTLAAAQQTVTAAQAGVDRSAVLARIVSALADAQLRPGADSSRAQAELAAARIQLLQSQQAVEVARATVAQFTGIEPAQVSISLAALANAPPQQSPAPSNSARNPLAVEQQSAIDETRAQLHILERSYFPKFNLQAVAYGRGTGAERDGTLLGGLNGLAPTVQDYALGFTVTFPVADLAAIRARKAEQSSQVQAGQARYEQLARDLKAQWNRAVAALDGARQIAANTPLQTAAASAASEQARARYQAGIGILVDVADAQRLLTQAEIDDSLARLAVWRALLSIAVAAGDIQPFLTEASQ